MDKESSQVLWSLKIINFSLNLNTENDYELNLDSEFVDFEPFISEMIIDKLEINYLCKINCKGLCSDCGLNMNKNDCNHEEKKLKEKESSPEAEDHTIEEEYDDELEIDRLHQVIESLKEELDKEKEKVINLQEIISSNKKVCVTRLVQFNLRISCFWA